MLHPGRSLRTLLGRIVALRRRNHRDDDLRDELESLAALEHDERVASGASTDEARRHVLARRGSVTAVQEGVHERRTIAWLDALIRDARYGVRGLRRTRGGDRLEQKFSDSSMT